MGNSKEKERRRKKGSRKIEREKKTNRWIKECHKKKKRKERAEESR